MKIQCSICQHELVSAIITPDPSSPAFIAALADISGLLARHVTANHRRENVLLAQNISTIQQYSVWLMLMDNCALIPESEQGLLDTVDAYRDVVYKVLGLEIEEDIETGEQNIKKIKKEASIVGDENKQESNIETPPSNLITL